MFSKEKVGQLKENLGQDALRRRDDNGRTYVAGYYIIDTANEIFGFDGWSYTIEELKYDSIGKYGIFRALVKLQVVAEAVVTRCEVGFGIPAGDSVQAYETAGKAAVTDAMKRAFRTFGSRFGNDLYDKDNPVHELVSKKLKEPKEHNATKGAQENNVANPVSTKSTAQTSEVIQCEACGKHLKNTPKYSVEDIVGYSTRKCDGHILCYAHQQTYPHCLNEPNLNTMK